MFYTYILRCSDNSLYTGYTTDYKRRFSEHFERRKSDAKYTKSRAPISVEAICGTDTKSSAMKLEAFIKKLNKSQKEELINDLFLLDKKLDDTLKKNIYIPINYENTKY